MKKHQVISAVKHMTAREVIEAKIEAAISDYSAEEAEAMGAFHEDAISEHDAILAIVYDND